MKTSATQKITFGCLGLAIATLLPSCVDPYAQGSGQATVTTYRSGYEVRSLPPGYRTERIDGSSYYVHNGTYFRPRSGRYVVVDAPRVRRDEPRQRYNDRQSPQRDVAIRTLPRGYRPVQYRGTRYYQVDDTYYQQRGSGYVIVNRPY